MKKLLFWEWPRGSWQYDIIVGLILAFIFLTPKEIFKDQPRPSSIVQLEQDGGAKAYLLEDSLLARLSEQARPARAAELLTKRYGKPIKIARVEPLVSPAGHTIGYMAVVQP